jgi:hypothetical protein
MTLVDMQKLIDETEKKHGKTIRQLVEEEE